MFTIKFFQNGSATNVVNKQLTGIVDAQGALRRGTSVIDPVIIVHTDGNPLWAKGANYAQIEAFGRYYYITNMIAVDGTFESQTQVNPTQLWEIHMHVDVLMSYAQEIKNQKAIVARQASQYNLMLDDGLFMVYQDPKIQTKTFSNATPFETQEFVLIVAGS
ncbi:MAG: hypothetical protein HDS66_09370 [Bacteroidales bacterium]|nr:hypothetical protein [Bacteroidales bacterium]